MNNTVLKIVGTVGAGVVVGGIVLIFPKEIAAVITAAGAAFAVWKYVAVKELWRIVGQAKTVADKVTK